MNDRIAGQNDLAIGPGTRVSLHFSILLADGQEIDGTRKDSDPAIFNFGDGQLLPGFEEAMVGLRAGDARQIALAPEQAFGEGNPGNLRTLPRAQFGKDIALEPGLIVSFASPEGEMPGVVKSLSEGQVVVDFNHPLAGQTVIFDVAIEQVVPAG